LIQQFNTNIYAMVSAAHVKDPEPDEPSIEFVNRYSGSIYTDYQLGNWNFSNTLIYGLINFYDHVSALNSVGEEFLFEKNKSQIWGRIEVLQRTPEELAVEGAPDDHQGRWVKAVTLGYTHKIKSWEDASLKLGGSVTKDFLPEAMRAAYGDENPWTAKAFLQVSGMTMWDI